MAFVDDFLDEIETLVRTTLSLPVPDDGTVNFLTTIRATKRNFPEQLEDGRISLACVVVGMGNYAPAVDAGANGVGLNNAPLDIFLVKEWSYGDQADIVDDLWKVAFAIDKPDALFDTFATTDCQASIISDVDSPINSSLLANSSVQIISGLATWRPGILVQVY